MIVTSVHVIKNLSQTKHKCYRLLIWAWLVGGARLVRHYSPKKRRVRSMLHEAKKEALWPNRTPITVLV